MKLADAQQEASQVCAALAPSCERWSVAGSVRREKSEVKDLELVVIPRQESSGDLFGVEWQACQEFCAVVNQWTAIKGSPLGKYTQRRLPSGLVLDLFIATPENYGAILLIRTGDAEFSQYMMGTLLPRHGYRQTRGYLWKDGIRLSVPDERDVFALVGIDPIAPSQRCGSVLLGARGDAMIRGRYWWWHTAAKVTEHWAFRGGSLDER